MQAIKLSEEPKRREWPFFTLMDVYFSDQVNDPSLRLFSSTKRFDTDTFDDKNFDEELQAVIAAANINASMSSVLQNIGLGLGFGNRLSCLKREQNMPGNNNNNNNTTNNNNNNNNINNNNNNTTTNNNINKPLVDIADIMDDKHDDEEDNKSEVSINLSTKLLNNNIINSNNNNIISPNDKNNNKSHHPSLNTINHHQHHHNTNTTSNNNNNNNNVEKEKLIEPNNNTISSNKNLINNSHSFNVNISDRNSVNSSINNNNNDDDFEDNMSQAYERNLKNINQKFLHEMNEHHNIDQYLLSWRGFHGNMCKGFHNLQRDGQMVDVTIAAGGKIFKAHKLVSFIAFKQRIILPLRLLMTMMMMMMMMIMTKFN